MRSRRQRGSAKRVVFEGGRADILERTFEQTVVLRSWRDERAVDDLARVARDKVRRLGKAYQSQVGRDWWDEETFLGLARLRGVECRSRYAEAFTVSKATLSW